MKRLLAVITILASTGCVQAKHNLASMDDIILLTQKGLSDETILAFLQSRDASLTLDADDIDRLLNAGASEVVIRYMIEQSSDLPTKSKTAPTYVADYPYNYYTPYYSSYAMSSIYFGYAAYPYYLHYNHGKYRSADHHYRAPHSKYSGGKHSSSGISAVPYRSGVKHNKFGNHSGSSLGHTSGGHSFGHSGGK